MMQSQVNYFLATFMAIQVVQAADQAKVTRIYVEPNSLSSWKRVLLAAQGTRLSSPGKERQIIGGQFTRGGTPPITVVITKELPDKIRLDLVSASGKPIIASGTTSLPSSISDDDKDLLEAFYLDTPEYFFLGADQGASSRLLGGHVRADGGTSANYQGPWHLVYRIAAPKTVRSEPGSQFKMYAFDTKDGSLSSVKYQVSRLGRTVEVTVEYSGWKSTAGELIPSQIRRLEDAIEIWRFQITSASFIPFASDKLFQLP